MVGLCRARQELSRTLLVGLSSGDTVGSDFRTERGLRIRQERCWFFQFHRMCKEVRGKGRWGGELPILGRDPLV